MYVVLLLVAVVMATDEVAEVGAEVKVTILIPPEVTTELPVTCDRNGLPTDPL